jgi:hypothetical protein
LRADLVSNIHAIPLPPSIPALHMQLSQRSLSALDQLPGAPNSVTLPSAIVQRRRRDKAPLSEYVYQTQPPLFESTLVRVSAVNSCCSAPTADYCAECLQRAPLGRSIACQGQCKRIWHADCAPVLDGVDTTAWLCPDCVANVQACFVCKHISRPGEQVFPCSSGCGLFYHPGCMEVWFQTQVPLERWRSMRRSCYTAPSVGAASLRFS